LIDRSTARRLVITPDMLAPGSPGALVDFERRMRAAPPLVLVLIASNLLMYVGEIAAGALADGETIIEAGALVRDRVLAGETWRLISAMFLHGGPDHLIGNLIVLYVVGMAVEHAFGLTRAAVVYFVSGIAGGVLSMTLSPGPSVGASGAIFGLMGSLIVVLYQHRHRFHVRDKRTGFVLIAWALYQVATGFLTPFIDNFAHIGGLIGGAVTALLLRPTLLDRYATQNRSSHATVSSRATVSANSSR
jgi:rhomboid protease GluP